MPFLDKLRMNNLYPTMPIGDDGGDNTYERFRNEIAPMYDRNRVGQIGQQAMQPQPQMGGWNGTGANPMMGDGRPGNLTRMDTVYNPGITDAHPAEMLGMSRDPASDYQKGQLDIKNRQLQETINKNDDTNKLNQQRIGVSQQRADVYRFKASNPGLKFQIRKDTGNLESLDPISGKVTDLGPSQMGESDLIQLNQDNKIGLQNNQGSINSDLEDKRQGGRETLADMKARHDAELASLGASLKPTGTTRNVELTRDATGNVTGAKTTTQNDNTNTVMMYGPQGQGPYPVPANKMEQAKIDGMSVIKPMKPVASHGK